MIKLPTNTVIYLIEKSIKTYRKFAQQNIQNVESEITVDQALVLMLIADNPELTQIQMADLLFKDYASITRMIELMVKKQYLNRVPNKEDRRRSNISLSQKGELALTTLLPVISSNRKAALNGVSEEEQVLLKEILIKIIDNCTDEDKSVNAKTPKATAK